LDAYHLALDASSPDIAQYPIEFSVPRASSTIDWYVYVSCCGRWLNGTASIPEGKSRIIGATHDCDRVGRKTGCGEGGLLVGVIETVVAHDLCIGCGVCAAVCPAGNLQMVWSADGAWIPSGSGLCRRARPASASWNQGYGMSVSAKEEANAELSAKDIQRSVPRKQRFSQKVQARTTRDADGSICWNVRLIDSIGGGSWN